jgi:hypothetical protein
VTALENPDLLVFLSSKRRTPIGGMDDETRQELRRYAEAGGRMLLLGFATRLVHEIGIEPQAPDRFAVYRWGDNDQTLLGRYRFGVRVENPEQLELVAGLKGAWERSTGARRAGDAAAGGNGGNGREGKQRQDAFHLGGGEMVSVQSCHWELVRPQGGRVVGRLYRERDGEAKELGAAVLTAWGAGKDGRILAYGSLPEPWRQDPEIQHNARQFLRNAIRSLCGGGEGGEGSEGGEGREGDRDRRAGKPLRVVVFTDPGLPPTLPKALPPLARRELPGAAIVPHWGWQVPLNYQRDGRRPISPEAVVQQVLVPSFASGASLLDLHLWDSERGYPLAWDPQDPLRRPRTYHGGMFFPEWGPLALRRLAAAAHQRSMQVQTWLCPDPTRLGPPVEILACSKWLARELLDVRRFGDGALDGVGVHTWFDDTEGHTRRVLQRYQPAVHGYCTGVVPQFFPGFVGAVNANNGRPRGLDAAGVSKSWRDAFPPPSHMAALLDCRVRQPSAQAWGTHAHGGGSYGDWIVTQVNDFARERMGQGAAMWWQAFNDRTMTPAVVDYVHGVSMQPIKAAVAGHLWATGTGGYRDLLRGFVTEMQSGFGAEADYPAETPFLQNNHFRLHGTGGALLVDPTGLARFRSADKDGERAVPLSVAVSTAFMRSSWRGVRPRIQDLDRSVLDFVQGHPRGENGYGPLLRIGEGERGPGTFPAMLAHDQPGRWPRKVEMDVKVRPGHYELELLLRASEGRGIVEVQRDGQVCKLLAFQHGVGTKVHRLAFPVAAGGLRSWSLEVLGGGRVAIDSCRLTQRSQVSVLQAVPTEIRIRERAGHLAEILEHTVAAEFQERRVLRTIADLPGFVLTIEYPWLRAGPQVVREFDLPLHRTLARTTGQDPLLLRRSFVLRSSDPAVPDLAVIPVELPRYHHFEFTAKSGLRLAGFPRSNERVRVGFMFLRGRRSQSLKELKQVLLDVLEPLTLQLGEAGRARILPRAKVAHPRVVRVVNADKTPFRVREGGNWLWRGAQRAQDGGQWLLIYHQDNGSRDSRPVDVVNGSEMLAGVHPGPGSLYSLAISDKGDGQGQGQGEGEGVGPVSVTVRVLQTGPFLRAPSVVMNRSFNAVTLDDKPWRYVHGRAVFLPRMRGTYRIEVSGRSGLAEGDAQGMPALARTGAHVQTCRYDPSNQVLEVFTVTGEQSEDREYTAWFTGPVPVRVDGGELVPRQDFTYRGEQDAQAAEAAGVIVRFRPGLLRLHYQGREGHQGDQGQGDR